MTLIYNSLSFTEFVTRRQMNPPFKHLHKTWENNNSTNTRIIRIQYNDFPGERRIGSQNYHRRCFSLMNRGSGSQCWSVGV